MEKGKIMAKMTKKGQFVTGETIYLLHSNRQTLSELQSTVTGVTGVTGKMPNFRAYVFFIPLL